MGFYDKMTKQEIVDKCEELEARLVQLNELNISLKKDNEMLDGERDSLADKCKLLECELDTYKKREKLMWRVINRIMDTEELIDDLEDAAEELKDAFKLASTFAD